MGCVNKVILVGNLGADPEMKFTASGLSVCKFPLATTEKWTDADGNKQERTEWHRVVAWKGLAETAGQYLKKGRQVYIEGRIRYGSYEKDGIKHYSTDIEARNIVFLGSRGNGSGAHDAPLAHENAPGEEHPF